MLKSISNKKFELVKNKLKSTNDNLQLNIENAEEELLNSRINGTPEPRNTEYWLDWVYLSIDKYENLYHSIRSFATEETLGIYEVEEKEDFQDLFRSDKYFDFITLEDDRILGIASNVEQIKEYTSSINKLEQQNYSILKVTLDEGWVNHFSDLDTRENLVDITNGNEANIVFKVCFSDK